MGVETHQQGVAIGGRSGDMLSGDLARRAWTVLDHHRPPLDLGERGLDGARRDVSAAPGRECDHEARDRLVGVRTRHRPGRQGDRRRCAQQATSNSVGLPPSRTPHPIHRLTGTALSCSSCETTSTSAGPS
jgi:hypothetical protein